MIKKLFSGQINSITVAALLVALSSLASRFLGIYRDRILAGQFGAGDTLDAYYAAFRVPDMIFNLLILGALSAGFVPILTALIKDTNCKERFHFLKCPNKEAWEFTSNLINVLFVVVVVLSGIGILVSPFLMKLITPGFSGDKLDMTVTLSRIMFLSPIFLGISGVLGGILQSFKRFLVYSLAPILYNLGIIAGALYLVPTYGVRGLAWGVVMGAFLHMCVQIPSVFSLGFHYFPKIDLKAKNLKNIAVMMIPRTMSLAISQIEIMTITVIASTLAAGSLAIFNFSNNLQSFPVGIFGISFAIAAFPTLSAVAFDRKKLIDNFSHVFRQIIFFIVPSTVLLLTLRAQIIRVVLGTGQFNWEDTVLTINSMGFFIISLFAQASIPLLVRVCYARHNSKTPFFIGLFSSAVNVVLALYFNRKFGVAGLALAFSLANILNFALLWLSLRFEIGDMDEKRILVSTSKICAAALFAGVAIQGSKLVVWPYIDMSRTFGVFAQGIFAGIIGILAYIAFCSLLRSEEFFLIWNSIKRRINWRKVDTDDKSEARGI